MLELNSFLPSLGQVKGAPNIYEKTGISDHGIIAIVFGECQRNVCLVRSAPWPGGESRVECPVLYGNRCKILYSSFRQRNTNIHQNKILTLYPASAPFGQ